MRRNIYKLQLFTLGLNEEGRWTDFYLDMNQVIGWFIPLYDKHQDNLDGDGINIYVQGGEVFTVKQEPHLKDYLIKHVYTDEVPKS